MNGALAYALAIAAVAFMALFVYGLWAIVLSPQQMGQSTWPICSAPFTLLTAMTIALGAAGAYVAGAYVSRGEVDDWGLIALGAIFILYLFTFHLVANDPQYSRLC